jgi:hypothetical protein
VRWRAVQIEVVLLHVFAVVSFAIGQAEEPLLEDSIFAVPESQSKAEVLFVIGNTVEAVLAPAVRAGAGLIVGEIVPGVTTFAIFFADKFPTSLR